MGGFTFFYLLLMSLIIYQRLTILKPALLYIFAHSLKISLATQLDTLPVFAMRL